MEFKSCEPCESTEKRTRLKAGDEYLSESTNQQPFANGLTQQAKLEFNKWLRIKAILTNLIFLARARTQTESRIQQAFSTDQ